MSPLSAPKAQALLRDATLEPRALAPCRRRLTAFLKRYLPLFYRKEQSANAGLVVRGLLSDLERKTCEPIARRHGVPRKPIQFFVGAGKWDDEAVMRELREHVRETCAHPQGVLILDPTAFPKKGPASCGVKRQWCGRLGKLENCQVGVFLAYASPRGRGPLDRRLYLPQDWAQDHARRHKTHVPPEVLFRTKWQLGLDLLAKRRGEVPHGWSGGDDEFGRVAEFRAQLRAWQERYLLDAPCDTLVRDLERRRPRRRARRGRRREAPFVQARTWVAAQAPQRWQRFTVTAGEKGPLQVEALRVRVRTKAQGRVGPCETLLVTRNLEEPEKLSYALSNAEPDVPLAELVRVKCERQRIEELFAQAKGEAGLAQYEVRSWVGWHHHVTLSLLALWFLSLEKRRLGEKNPGAYGRADARALLATAS